MLVSDYFDGTVISHNFKNVLTIFLIIVSGCDSKLMAENKYLIKSIISEPCKCTLYALRNRLPTLLE